MAKLIATLNVVAWAGFWAFGYLALSAGHAGGQVALAALGGGLGLWAWLWLVKHSEATGYAPAPRRGYPDEEFTLPTGH
ncbi:hypothetical protein Q4543_00430 [Salipiger sp. 1_MG-2023]|uniref:hypothetical protein n=1 Tax=Salipiger sp. 1_MG-2023 TaxID=3062665 RepID=UPI0026E22689|nr:hypothetical protein [Salipiger sp. 1_MG-2023]MDO6583972.1 hypothetical protein [Salipiger sp. 1_MG-2023]